jgi:hypothetical protein
MLNGFSYDVHVYRLVKYGPGGSPPAGAKIIPRGTLEGRYKSHTIHGAVVCPKTTAVPDRAVGWAKVMDTDKIMYCQYEDDIIPSDYFAYESRPGKLEITRVGGGVINDWTSPFSMFYQGGKEVIMENITERGV